MLSTKSAVRSPICGHQGRQRTVLCTALGPAPQHSNSRRLVLGGLFTVTLLGSQCAPSEAALVLPNKEMSNDDPYIQELLRRTEAQREQRKKERLNAYYKKNFREYLEFDAGSLSVAQRRGISSDTQAKIAKWLKDNE